MSFIKSIPGGHFHRVLVLVAVQDGVGDEPLGVLPGLDKKKI
jgi:hypothetical protein